MSRGRRGPWAGGDRSRGVVGVSGGGWGCWRSSCFCALSRCSRPWCGRRKHGERCGGACDGPCLPSRPPDTPAQPTTPRSFLSGHSRRYLARCRASLCCAPFVFKNKKHPLAEHAGNMCFPRVAIDLIFIHLALAMINRIVDGILMALSWQ